MPHTSRKAKPSRHWKRQQVTTDDGWTHVSHAASAAAARRAFEKHSTAPPRDRGDPDLTIWRLRVEYASHLELWRASGCRRALGDALARRFRGREGREGRGVVLPEGGKAAGVRFGGRAVCLGLGALGTVVPRRRSMWQLVVFLDTTVLLEKLTGTTVTKFVQEPGLLAIDRELLGSLDVAVLEDDAAVDMVEGSFVFAPFMNKREEQPYACQAHRCPLYITTDLRHFLDGHEALWEDEEKAAHGRQLMEDCMTAVTSTHDDLAFPSFEHDEHALALRVYVLKEADID